MIEIGLILSAHIVYFVHHIVVKEKNVRECADSLMLDAS